MTGRGHRVGAAGWVAVLFVLVVACAATADTVHRLVWETHTPVPTPRTEVAASSNGRLVMVAGGFSEAGPMNVVEVYDTGSDSWRAAPPLPIGLNHAMAATLAGRVYVFGGYRGPGLANVTDRAFVFAGGGWREIARMPQPRAAGGSAAAGDRIYVVGGVRSDDQTLGTFTMVYDPATNRWSAAAGLGIPRQHLGVASYGGLVYSAGGRIAGLDSNLDAAEVFDPSAGTWSVLPDLPTARGGLAAAATSNGFIVAAGGEQPTGTFDAVEGFDVATGQWISLPPMPTARHGLGVAAVGAEVYVMAGGPDPGLTYTDANESIDLAGLRGA